jgi:hypothetical protein
LPEAAVIELHERLFRPDAARAGSAAP